MATAADRESLFSLEVVVDEVRLPDITCRYPSVAVRLMDFPTLMINLTDARLIRRIQINLQQKAEIPRQFDELHDENGNFTFQKGKSCLFKFSAKNLRMHLRNTPMYILVVDTFPEIPKLIASCVVPLTHSMDKLYDHITNVGLAIPETDGQRGEFVLRNLMGVNIGSIVFGYRLISLGEGLLQHIPKESLVVQQTEEERKEEPLVDPDLIPERDTPKPELKEPQKDERPDRMSKLRKSKPEVLEITKVQHIFKESVMNLEFQNEGTQTDPPRKAVGVATHESEEELVYRPPPLYFNSTAEEKTIRPVEKSYFGFDYEAEVEDVEEVEEPQGMVYQSQRPVQMPRPQMQYADLQQNFAQFPVLGALLAELNRIQGGAFQSQQSAFHQVSPRAKPKPKPKAKSPVKPKVAVGKENRDAFLSRMAQPRPEKQVVKPSEEPAPAKTKSWLRKDPVIGAKKTKLQYGMTNTQRLRLAMNNPQMLREMEGDQPKSPIARRLLENLATLGKTRVLSDKKVDEMERPIPTPRSHPPVRHSHEFDKDDNGEEISVSVTPERSASPEELPGRKPSLDVHIPVAEDEKLDSLPPKIPGFKSDSDSDEPPVKDVRDSAIRMPVINPKASKNSPISSLRNSQAFTARSELNDLPSARPRPSLENIRQKMKSMKSVSFDNDESELESRQHRPDLVRSDSVSSYAPTEDSQGPDDDNDLYSDDFEVDIPMSPTQGPSLPRVDHMGYTY